MNFFAKIIYFIIIIPFWALAQKVNFRNVDNSNGLSHNSVFSITQDTKGFLWFGTREGVNKYDGKNIKSYYFESKNPNIEANRINAMLSSDKNIWLGTGNGIYIFDLEKEKFEKKNSTPLYVNTIQNGIDGKLLFCCNKGLLIFKNKQLSRHLFKTQNIISVLELKRDVFMTLESNQIRLFSIHGEKLFDITSENQLLTVKYQCVFRASDGTILIGTNQGIFYFDEKKLTIKPYEVINTTDFVRAITEDKNHNIWIGTEDGVYLFEKRFGKIQKLNPSLENSKFSLTDKSVYSLFVSKDGIVWVGTYFGGVNFYNPNKQLFQFLQHDNSFKNSISGKAISQIREDESKNIWVATEDGGVSVLDKNLNFLKSYSKTNGLNDNNIHSLLIENSKVWVGTFQGGLNVIDIKTGQGKYWKNNSKDLNSISNNSVYAILRDSNGKLWVGTQAGLNVYNDKNGTFTSVFPEYLGSQFIYDLHEDSFKNLWIATRFNGVFRLNLNTSQLISYSTTNTKEFPSNQIISIFEDSKKTLWFGSLGGGVAQYDNQKKSFVIPTFVEKLPNKTVYGILQDSEKNYWFSTNKGLIRVNPKNQNLSIFDQSAGLNSTQFNFKSYLLSSEGFLLFGSIKGLCVFKSSEVFKNQEEPICHLTSLKLFNKEVKINENEVLDRHIDEIEEIELENDQNVISIDFVTLNYSNNGNNFFIYYLKGFEENWNPKSNQGTATYTNLSAGTYTFHLKALRNDGSPSSAEKKLIIKINPPFWLSWYAFAFYLGVIAIGLFLYARFVKFVNTQKLEVRLANIEKEKNEIINQQKLDLFAYLSNEFKTPLTIITAVIEEITSNEYIKKQDLENYSKIFKKNTQQLQVLIKKLGSLRGSNTQFDKDSVSKNDVIAFIKECISALNPIINPLEINIERSFSHPYFLVEFDAQKTEIILNNVFFEVFSRLSKKSKVEIRGEISNFKENKQAMCQIKLSVSDIEQFKIVESGLVAELLKEINGKLEQPNGINTMIIISFPMVVSQNHSASFEVEKSQTTTPFWLEEEPNQMIEKNEKLKPKLLIAEKNNDFQLFLKKHFQESFDVILTNNFYKTLEKVSKYIPDIIICDENIGSEVNQSIWKTLKLNTETAYIPIILLLESDIDTIRLKALADGVNSILAKPFKIKELDLLTLNILRSQMLLKNRYSRILNKDSEVFVNNKGLDFIQSFNKIIENNYRNTELSVDYLAKAMNCSRSTLHNKITEISSMSVIEYLNEFRLKIAYELLRNGKNVLETSIEVGYNDPNYFGRIFKQKYGKSPKNFFKT